MQLIFLTNFQCNTYEWWTKKLHISVTNFQFYKSVTNVRCSTLVWQYFCACVTSFWCNTFITKLIFDQLVWRKCNAIDFCDEHVTIYNLSRFPSLCQMCDFKFVLGTYSSMDCSYDLILVNLYTDMWRKIIAIILYQNIL